MAAPEASYDDPSTSTRDVVRFLSGDTGRLGGFYLSDAEIDWLVSQYATSDGTPRPYATAAAVCDAMETQARQQADATVGDVQITWSSSAKRFSALAVSLRTTSGLRDPGADIGPLVFGGATDADPRYFRVGEFDHPGTGIARRCP